MSNRAGSGRLAPPFAEEEAATFLGGMTRRSFLQTAMAGSLVDPVQALGLAEPATGERYVADALFASPPDDFKPWALYWWFQGATSPEGITRDLEEMRRQGIAGIFIFSGIHGDPNAPEGPAFMSDEWRDSIRHTEREAHRLGLKIGLNLCDGWNAGGPWVGREDAVKDLVWSEIAVDGGRRLDIALPRPAFGETRIGFGATVPRPNLSWYRDVVVLACPVNDRQTWEVDRAIDLTDSVRAGRLRWSAPAGRWTILRFGCVLNGAQTKLNPAIPGWEVDPLSAEAMDRHFAQTGAKLAEDAGALVGSTVKYVHVDSWEIGDPTWTLKLPDEFSRRRGYDMLPYLPALAGKVVTSADISDRFKLDYRRTIADLIAENYYGRLAQLAHGVGLRLNSQAGGAGGMYTHNIDALQCLGACDIPMGEYWTNFDSLNRIVVDAGVAAPVFQNDRPFPDSNHGSIRQAAIAARIYGRPICHAEAFTGIKDDWTEDPYFLKPAADRAFCLGLTRNVLSFSVAQADISAKPGYQWEHVGTHFDRNITWWNSSHAFFTYLARCQYMLTRGTFAADILYFAGEAIPNYVVTDEKPVPGYDFDAVNAQVLLTRLDTANGMAVLPGGLSYRYLVLPEGGVPWMSAEVLGKIAELVERGMSLVGPRPSTAPGLSDRSGARTRALADTLWGPERAGIRTVGRGRVIWGRTLEDVLRSEGLAPDLEIGGLADPRQVDWIHRRLPDGDAYFIANFSEDELSLEPIFRVAARAPELWDPVTGEIRRLSQYRETGDRTAVPIRLASRQSLFILFRSPGSMSGAASQNFPVAQPVQTLSGPWEVSFDPEWGPSAPVRFDELVDWATHPDEDIRYYSGSATYRKRFDLTPGTRRPRFLDLGAVKNLAEVRLNGQRLGIVWTAPWRVDISSAVRRSGNRLEIEVTNLWPNRLIGDARLPREQRRTVTNVRTYDRVLTANTPFFRICPHCTERIRTGEERALLPSGLIGPVRLLAV